MVVLEGNHRHTANRRVAHRSTPPERQPTMTAILEFILTLAAMALVGALTALAFI